MRALAYPNLPTLIQWKKDSAVGNWKGPYRRADPTLLRIDRMVNSLNKPQAAGAYAYKLGGLFFTTMYWNNNHKFSSNMENGRRPAIMRLHLCAANKLAAAFKCGLGLLASKLQEVYGVGMSEHGVNTDGPGGMKGEYLDHEERQNYRVIFRGGLAYRFDPKLTTNPTMNLEPFNNLAYGQRNKQDQRGWLFVMSMSNELYSYPVGGYVKYHSSFMGGIAVNCAGTIDYLNGVITYIKNDSGHYKPVDESLAKVLRHLKTIGVNIQKITVEQLNKEDKISEEEMHTVFGKALRDEFGDQFRTQGDIFLQNNGNWDAIKKSSAARGHKMG